MPTTTSILLDCIASDIFSRHRIDFSLAIRGQGWTNATWIADGLVLRLATQPGSDHLRREAMLAALLPPAVGYPSVIEIGVIEGYEWCLSRWIPGQSLGEVWDDLREEQRLDALCQLWETAQAVHFVDLHRVEGCARREAWFNATDPDRAQAGIRVLEEQKILSPLHLERLNAGLSQFWSILPSATPVLNHGDLTLENAIWHQSQVVSLLDFEFAVIAPVELDLNSLVKMAFLPETGETTKAQKAVMELAAPVLDRPNSKGLLYGYALLLELWKMEDYLAHPEGEGPLEGWSPYRRLISLLDGQHGYLRPLLSA